MATPSPSAAPPQPSFDIEAYDVEGNTLLDQATVETAIYPYLGPGRVRDDVAAARDALQKAYQTRGYQSVVVEVPQQDARTGVVRLHVVEAPIGRLRVVNSRYDLPSRIKEQLPSLRQGQVPNFTQAQKEIVEANRLPDRQITPLVKPGKVPGTVDIDLKVTDTLPVHASAELNNDHAQNTAPLRTVASVSYGNLWQLGHTVSASAILAPENLKNAEVFLGSYVAPVWNTPWSVVISGNVSNSNVPALGGASVLGKGYSVSASGALELPPLDDFAQTFSIGLNFKHSVSDVQLFGQNPAAIDYWPIVASYSLARADGTSTTDVSTSLTLGTRGLGSGVAGFFNNRASARGNFVHFNMDVLYTRELFEGMQWSGHLSGQVADQPLITNEQFTAGGLTSVRGYLQSEALGDDGVLASIELTSSSLAPWTNSLTSTHVIDDWRFYEFADTAMAWMLDSLPQQKSVSRIASFGVGTRLQLLSHFSANVLVGVPLRDGPATKAGKPYTEFSVKTEL